MAIALDQIARKKLVLVKQLYQRAVLDSQRAASKLKRILAIIEFDLAIETILKTFVGALDTTKTPDSDFHKLIEQANLSLRVANLGSVSDEAHIKYIRRTRNNAQHQAIYPNETELSDCRTYTRDFLYAIATQVWGIDFEKISLSELIEDSDIKQFILDAYQNFEEQNYSVVVDLASEGMDRALSFVEDAIIGNFSSFISGIALTDSFRKGNDEYLLHDSHHSHDEREMLDVFKRMRKVLIYLALDIDISEFEKYEQIVGYTYFTMDDKHHRHSDIETVSQDNAEFVLTYCINTIARIEEITGSIKKPFGRENYWE